MAGKEELERLRREIDPIDKTILVALQRRGELVDQIAAVKRENGLEVYQPDRFAQLLGYLQLQAADLGVDPQLVTEVWSAIHDSSRRQQTNFMTQPAEPVTEPS